MVMTSCVVLVTSSCRRCALRTYIALSASSSARPASACGPRIATPADAPAVTVRPRNMKVSRSMACSSDAALACASVSLRFHNSSANSSPPSRPITSEERTWRAELGHDRLQHLIAGGVPEGVVDRLQAIDIEHDQRAAGMIALDIGDRAVELALEAAPVRNIQQEVGIGARPAIPRSASAPAPVAVLSRRMVGLASLDATGGRDAEAGRSSGLARGGAALRSATTLLRRFAALGAVALVFFFMGISCEKACRNSPRQDSPFRTPCHALPNHGPIL